MASESVVVGDSTACLEKPLATWNLKSRVVRRRARILRLPSLVYNLVQSCASVVGLTQPIPSSGSKESKGGFFQDSCSNFVTIIRTIPKKIRERYSGCERGDRYCTWCKHGRRIGNSHSRAQASFSESSGHCLRSESR